MFLHSIWHYFGILLAICFIGQMFCHSYLAYILTFRLACFRIFSSISFGVYFLTFCLAFYLAFSLACVRDPAQLHPEPAMQSMGPSMRGPLHPEIEIWWSIGAHSHDQLAEEEGREE